MSDLTDPDLSTTERIFLHLHVAEEALLESDNAPNLESATFWVQEAHAHAAVARVLQEERRWNDSGVRIETWQGSLPDEPPQWMVDLGYERPKPDES